LVCRSVCWSRSPALQKQLDRSRCRLGVDLYGSKELCIRWDQGRTNSFAAARGVTRRRCDLSSKYFEHLLARLASRCRRRPYVLLMILYFQCCLSRSTTGGRFATRIVTLTPSMKKITTATNLANFGEILCLTCGW